MSLFLDLFILFDRVKISWFRFISESVLDVNHKTQKTTIFNCYYTTLRVLKYYLPYHKKELCS